MATITLADRELAAELAVLYVLDRVRAGLGHDYGAGQRGGELRRRVDALEPALDAIATAAMIEAMTPAPALERKRDLIDTLEQIAGDVERLTGDELVDAVERILRPRERRVDREDYRHRCAATTRTRRAYALTRRMLDAAPLGAQGSECA